MSAPIEQVILTEQVLNEQVVLNEQDPIVEEVKDKKPKKPSLPAKHAKFMQFGAWFAQLLLESGDIDSALFDKMRAKLTVFDDFHTQMSFYSAFADQHKDFNKSLRKEILALRRSIAKANKPPKSKKSSLSDKSQSDFIAHIISDAQSSLPLTPPQPVLPMQPVLPKENTPKQPKAPKQPKEKNPKESKEPKEKNPKESKEKTPKESKEKTPKESNENTPKDPTPEVVQQSVESPPLPPATPSVTLPPTPPPSTDNKPLTMKKPKKVKKTSATDEPTA